MTDLDTLFSDLSSEYGDDPFDLDHVIVRLQQAFPEARPGETRWMTLQMLRQLLDAGMVVAGFPTSEGGRFRPWALTPNQVINRIFAAWDELGRAPKAGEVAWFLMAPRDEAPVLSQELKAGQWDHA